MEGLEHRIHTGLGCNLAEDFSRRGSRWSGYSRFASGKREWSQVAKRCLGGWLPSLTSAILNACMKGHLDGELGSHLWVYGRRRWKPRERPLSPHSRRLRVRLLQWFGFLRVGHNRDAVGIVYELDPGLASFLGQPWARCRNAFGVVEAGRGFGDVLGRIHAIEGGDRFTRRRGDAEKRHLEGRRSSHRLVNSVQRWKVGDPPLSPRSPRLRVRILLHGYGLEVPYRSV